MAMAATVTPILMLKWARLEANLQIERRFLARRLGEQ
jgi:hypothetical protein